MRENDLTEYLNRQPFQPFRLYLSTGAFLDVRQPQLVHVSRSTLTIGQGIEGNQQRFLVVALIHIVLLEVLIPAP